MKFHCDLTQFFDIKHFETVAIAELLSLKDRMKFHCDLKQVFDIKHFETVANKELLFPSLFPTDELLFEKLYPKIYQTKLSGDSI